MLGVPDIKCHHHFKQMSVRPALKLDDIVFKMVAAAQGSLVKNCVIQKPFSADKNNFQS